MTSLVYNSINKSNKGVLNMRNLNIKKETKEELKRLQLDYFKAKAAVDTIKKIAEENVVEVLQENEFYNDEGDRVLLASHSWTIKAGNFTTYLELVFGKNVDSGLPVTNPELVPGYPEEEKVNKIESKLFKLQLEIIPEDMKEDIKEAQQHWKYREKALDLILRLTLDKEVV